MYSPQNPLAHPHNSPKTYAQLDQNGRVLSPRWASCAYVGAELRVCGGKLCGCEGGVNVDGTRVNEA